VFAAGLVAVMAWTLWTSREFGFRAGLFPWAIGFPVLVLAIVQLARELRGETPGIGMAGAEGMPAGLPTDVVYRRTAGIAGWTGAFFVAFWLLGLSIAAPMTTLLYLRVGAGEKWPLSLLLTAGVWLLCHGLFVYTLQVPFPAGILFGGFD